MKTRLIIGVGMVTLLGLTACRDGASTATSTSTATSGGASGLNKEDFIAQADAICKKADDKRASITTDLQNASSIDEARDIVTTRLIPAYEDELHDMRALEPNDDIKDEVNSVFDTLESAIEHFKKDPTAVVHGIDPLQEAWAWAQGFGFESCFQYTWIDMCDTAFGSSETCGV